MKLETKELKMARSEVCQVCCPSGGALFRRDLVDGEFHDKVCQNCGHIKAPRKMAPRPSFSDIMDNPSVDPAKLNRFELASFHAFNPAGISAEWKKLDDEIIAAMDAKLVKGGFWVVYGRNGYHLDNLYRLALAKQFKVWDLNYHVNKIRETITEGRAKLEEARNAA